MMLGSVLIGVHVTEQPALLEGTLASLRTHVPQAAVAVLPDAVLTEAINPRGATLLAGQAPGRAAAFNRLIGAGREALVVLLESGCRVGPGWFQRICGALNAHPSHGLAGPSTNRAWNEQKAIDCEDHASPTQIAAAAYAAARRYAGGWTPLTPLHSLADFCYAVRRPVIDAIGGADEAYGAGPCWEMDYNIRAARAGYAGVWARGAFVHRRPPGPVQTKRESSHFTANRQLYQRRFCGARLGGQKAEFKEHCLGEACANFAPTTLIQLRRPLSLPLVSCVMATGAGRRRFVEQSLRLFQRQDYPNRELVIVGDEATELAFPLPANVRFHRVTGPMSIGAKRNLGCELARGEIIAHWDDDDWYSTDRLSRQLRSLLDGRAEISGLVAEVMFDLPRWVFWTCSAELHNRLFVGDVSGGTLVYWRGVWDRLARYPDTSLAEDAEFLAAAMTRGARLHRVCGSEDLAYIYLRHGANTWSFECGQFVDPSGWRQVPEPAFAAEDRAFYASMAPRPALAGAAPC